METLPKGKSSLEKATRAKSTTLAVRVELFGSARLLCGKRSIEIMLPENALVSDLTAVLSQEYPDLRGKVITEDGSSLLESYTLNINGAEFVSGEALPLKQGDTLLLFSSQAGG